MVRSRTRFGHSNQDVRSAPELHKHRAVPKCPAPRAAAARPLPLVYIYIPSVPYREAELPRCQGGKQVLSPSPPSPSGNHDSDSPPCVPRRYPLGNIHIPMRSSVQILTGEHSHPVPSSSRLRGRTLRTKKRFSARTVNHCLALPCPFMGPRFYAPTYLLEPTPIHLSDPSSRRVSFHVHHRTYVVGRTNMFTSNLYKKYVHRSRPVGVLRGRYINNHM